MARRADKGLDAGGGGRAAKPAREPNSTAPKPAPPPDFVMPDLPPEMFSPLGMLALADVLPVMTAYIDKEQRYRFLNKPLADWFERPRSEILGKTLKEVLGEEAYAVRAPLIA